MASFGGSSLSALFTLARLVFTVTRAFLALARLLTRVLRASVAFAMPSVTLVRVFCRSLFLSATVSMALSITPTCAFATARSALAAVT